MCDCDFLHVLTKGSDSDLMIAKHKLFVRRQRSLYVIDKFSVSLNYDILTFNTLLVRYGKRTNRSAYENV